MSSKFAEAYLYAYRREGPNEPAMEKALKLAERDPELARRLEEQVAFDAQMARAVHAIAPPEKLREKLGGGEQSGRVKGRPFAKTLFVAIFCGISVTIGLMVLFALDRRDKFTGSESVARIAGTAKNMTGSELEQVSNKAGQMVDWFYMRGFEPYALPPELANAPTVGSRVFRLDGHAVAQLLVDWHESVVYLFRADDFGVDLPQDADWRVLAYDDWTAAVRKRGGICTLITFRGSRADMREFLKTLHKS